MAFSPKPQHRGRRGDIARSTSTISLPIFGLQTNIPSFQAVHLALALYIRWPKMEPENELIAQRREKLQALRAKGVDPFGAQFETTGSVAEIREKFREGETLCAAGRMTAHRDMGKSHFVDLRDVTGRLQIYLHEKEIGADAMEVFKLLD